MAWGVLEDTITPRPPGTVLLHDVEQAAMIDAGGSEFAHLKKDKHIVLQPQPTDSVNDPLNWPMKRKITIIGTLITTGVAVGGMMAMLGTAGRQLAERFHISYPDLIQTLNPPGIASNAVALFFASAISAVYGKRIGLVLGAFALWINMLAGYFANSVIYYRNLGIVGGIFGAPGELLLGPIITDLIFVHQRGRLMALAAVVGVIGGDASHVIAGNIIAKLGVKYLYIISFAVMTPFLVAIYWFVWETTYERPSSTAPVIVDREVDDNVEAIDSSSGRPDGTVYGETDNSKVKLSHAQDQHKSTSTQSPEDLKLSTIDIENIKDRVSTRSANSLLSPMDQILSDPEHTLRQNLRIFRGRVTDRSLIKAIFQPFPYMIFPAVIFSTVINGAFMTWTIMSGIISSQVLLYPPYDLQPDTLAYLGLPGSVVGLVSAILAGYASDKLIQWMARRNNGIYEPEYRLILMIPAIMFSTIGFLILGPLYAQHAAVWKLVLTGLLFQLSGPFASSACVTYIFDTMQNSTTEAFVATSLFKHIFIYFAASYVPSWFAKAGAVKVYQTLAVLNLSFAALAIPMYIFGKQIRGAVFRNKRLMAAARTASGKI